MMAFAMVVTLTGCGGNEGGTVSEGMSNQNLMKMETVHDGWVYGAGNASDEYKDVVFTATKLDGSEKKIINEKSIPTYVNVYNEKLYYILALPDGSKLFRSDLDGKNEEQLLKGVNIGSYQIVDDKIYFQEMDFNTDMLMGVFQCDMDGKNPKEVLMKEMVSPYVVGDKLYYQDIANNETYYAYDMKTKKNKKVSKKYTYMLSVDDEYAYGINAKESIYATEDMKGNLVKINLETGESETLKENIYGGFLQVAAKDIYFIDNETGAICKISKKGGEAKTVIEDSGVGNAYLYGNDLVYITYDDVGYFGDVYVCGPKGGDSTKL